jgi:hypothetical protein
MNYVVRAGGAIEGSDAGDSALWKISGTPDGPGPVGAPDKAQTEKQIRPVALSMLCTVDTPLLNTARGACLKCGGRARASLRFENAFAAWPG